MKIGIICGSHRFESESERVGKYIATELERNAWCAQVWLYSLKGNPLPMWQGDVWDKKHTWHKHLCEVAEQLDSCDGLVIISPEWNGMAPPALKNFFLFWHKRELAHKPAALVAISAEMGGGYPIAELRMSSYKNQFLCYMPDQIIIRHVNDVLHPKPDTQWSEQEQNMRMRIRYTLDMLGEYATALQQVRSGTVWDPERYPSGM